MTDADALRHLDLLPSFMQQEIMRFKLLNDQRLMLMGRLIVHKFFLESGFHWGLFNRAENGKPYVSGMQCFNISHSGSIVIVAFSEFDIGIDIEFKKREMDFNSIIDYMHPCERAEFLCCSDRTDTFFKIWTRKEAFLKAKGNGIVDGLNEYNCLENIVNDGAFDWEITELNILDDYSIALCQKAPIGTIDICEAGIHEF
jgi:4'-phosphopantetheinyl transferase